MFIQTKIFKYSSKQSLTQSFASLLGTLSTEEKIIRMNIFLGADNTTQYLQSKEAFTRALQEAEIDFIPTNYIAQQTLDADWAVEIEVIQGIAPLYKSHKQAKYTILELGKTKTLYIAGIQDNPNTTIREQSQKVFILFQEILDQEQMCISNIVRQWNYIANITQMEGSFQHYQIFNDERTHFYDQEEWAAGYPAATGIGMQSGGILLSAIVCSRPEQIIPLVNPDQLDAHVYSQKVLIGEKDQKKQEKTTPKFERAKLLQQCKNEQVQIFISGTASILGEQTMFPDDVVKQTKQTIKNIQRILKNDYLHFTPQLATVYIKNKSDFEKVKQVCVNIYNQLPTLYLHADVCRSELLVEIEALYTHKQ